MTNPQPYQVSYESGYGQPIYMAHGPGPGVTTAMHGIDGGTPAYLVHEPVPGAQAVWFVNGPPVGSVEWMVQQAAQQQQQYAAWAAAQAQVHAQAHRSAAVSAEQHLLQL